MESSYWITTGLGAIIAPPLVSLLGLRGAMVAVGCCLPLVAALRWASLARFEAGAAIPEHAFALLRRVPMFAPLAIGTLENLSLRLVEMDVPAGQAVVREGEPGDRVYLVDQGDFDVTCSRGAFPSIGEGEVFGEIALLRDVPRTATVSARTDARGVRARPRVVPDRRERPPLQRSGPSTTSQASAPRASPPPRWADRALGAPAAPRVT